MLEDHVFNEMKCVIHIGKEREKVLRDFQEKRAELVEKRLQRIPPHLLKSIDLYPLSKAC